MDGFDRMVPTSFITVSPQRYFYRALSQLIPANISAICLISVGSPNLFSDILYRTRLAYFHCAPIKEDE